MEYRFYWCDGYSFDLDRFGQKRTMYVVDPEKIIIALPRITLRAKIAAFSFHLPIRALYPHF